MADDAHTRADILNFLAAHNTLTLATAHDGVAWANALFYAHDELALYFLSEPKTRHATNLAHNPRVAVTINEDCRDWRVIQGVQLEGECIAITDAAESARAFAIYSAKYPFVAATLGAKEIGDALTRAHFYKITPRWIRLIDNTRGFGFKEEIRWEAE